MKKKSQKQAKKLQKKLKEKSEEDKTKKKPSPKPVEEDREVLEAHPKPEERVNIEDLMKTDDDVKTRRKAPAPLQQQTKGLDLPTTPKLPQNEYTRSGAKDYSTYETYKNKKYSGKNAGEYPTTEMPGFNPDSKSKKKSKLAGYI